MSGKHRRAKKKQGREGLVKAAGGIEGKGGSSAPLQGAAAFQEDALSSDAQLLDKKPAQEGDDGDLKPAAVEVASSSDDHSGGVEDASPQLEGAAAKPQQIVPTKIKRGDKLAFCFVDGECLVGANWSNELADLEDRLKAEQPAIVSDSKVKYDRQSKQRQQRQQIEEELKQKAKKIFTDNLAPEKDRIKNFITKVLEWGHAVFITTFSVFPYIGLLLEALGFTEEQISKIGVVDEWATDDDEGDDRNHQLEKVKEITGITENHRVMLVEPNYPYAQAARDSGYEAGVAWADYQKERGEFLAWAKDDPELPLEEAQAELEQGLGRWDAALDYLEGCLDAAG